MSTESYIFRLVPVTEEVTEQRYYSVTPLSRRLYHTRAHALSARRGAGKVDEYKVQSAPIGDWKDCE